MCVMLLFVLPLLFFTLEAVSGREILFQIPFQMPIEADGVELMFFSDDTPASAAQHFVDDLANHFGHDFSHKIEPLTRMLIERRALFGDNLEIEPHGPVLFSVPAPSGLGGAALPDVYFHEVYQYGTKITFPYPHHLDHPYRYINMEPKIAFPYPHHLDHPYRYLGYTN
jgi:hypothetical protein